MTDQATLHATRQFFGPRASGWEQRFPDDRPQYAHAITELKLTPGLMVLDLGCGRGRALVPLRAAVGSTGRVVGLDVTPEMLAEAQQLGRRVLAALVYGDVLRLPFVTTCADAVFAGGLLPYLAEPLAVLHEIARVTRPGGKLAIFHLIGRGVLAACYGGAPSDNEMIRLPRSGSPYFVQPTVGIWSGSMMLRSATSH